ncbi:hypothetical protein BS78_10G083700 [Paspalum vaginatum]|nr:hypothetical protein BS78_10G083700 [Paspalum vaginatum]
MVKTVAAPAAGTKHGGGASRQQRAYKGVRMRSWGSWVSEVRAPGQKTRIWLGSHSTAEAAARAYDAALLCLKGSAAAADLNFPLRIPFDLAPVAMSPKAIQRVAAAAAASACGTGGAGGFADDGGCACSDGDGDAAPAWSGGSPSDVASAVSSPESTGSSESAELTHHGDGDVDTVDYGSLADIDAFFQSPKCMEYAMMDPCCAFFAPAPMAMDNDGCWEEDADIPLWSFSTLQDC